MGLKESIKDGAVFKRTDTTIITNNQGSGSITLGSAYILLGITTDFPCRLRLYDTLASVNDAGEIARTFGNTSISSSIALVTDISMSSAGIYTIDPVVYGVVNDSISQLSYYRLNETQSGNFPTITFTHYNIEDVNISTANRVNLPIMTASLAPLAMTYGTISEQGLPKTYLLVSASVSGSDTFARVRLYSTSEVFSDSTEMNRDFSVEPAGDTKLIVDAILSGSETTYFVPKIVGANLETTENNLISMQKDQEKIAGIGGFYYILQNMSTTDTRSISASVHVFELER